MQDTLTGGALIADQLVAAGVGSVFALGGAGHTHLLLPLEERGVRLIGTRHESGAVGAADGYARATGGIGVATIIAEQGLPNAITPIQAAYQYGSPVVVIVTRYPDSWIEAAGEIVVDHHAALRPITKWVRTVSSPERLGEYLEAAIRIAQSGRPGPVVLIMPQNLLAAPVPASAMRPAPVTPLPPEATPEAISALAELLLAAERPAILVDAGCGGADAIEGLRTLSETHGLPIFGYGGARGLVGEDDARGILPWPYAQYALPSCDLLIVAGARLTMWYGFGRAPRFPDALRVAQIDRDADAIGRNRAVTLGIVADPGRAMRQLARALSATGTRVWSQDWLDEALAPRRAAIEAIPPGEAIHPLALAQAIEARRPREGVLVGDGADVLNWSYGAFRITRPGGYMDHHPMGSMGTGMTIAIGAAAAEVDLAAAEGRDAVPVTLLTGDGAFGFYITELETIAREALPLRIVVGNDSQWGTEYHGQKLVTGRFVNTRFSLASYAKVAEGFGMASATVDHPVGLDAAIGALFETPAPALLDVRIDREAGAEIKRDPRLSFLIFSDLAPPSR